MKKLLIAAVVLTSTLASCSSSVESMPKVSTPKDSLSYAIGSQLGSMLKSASIMPEDIDMTVVAQTINAVYTGKEAQMKDQEVQAVMMAYFQNVLPEKVKAKNATEISEITKNNPNAKTTASGLIYEIIKEGDVSALPTPQDTVVLNYTGKLMDGTVFDSSVERGEPMTFAPLAGSIKGFQEGVGLIGPGGEIKIWIPSDLAYGAQGAGGVIGPNANIMFEVTVDSVKKAAELAK